MADVTSAEVTATIVETITLWTNGATRADQTKMVVALVTIDTSTKKDYPSAGIPLDALFDTTPSASYISLDPASIYSFSSEGLLADSTDTDGERFNVALLDGGTKTTMDLAVYANMDKSVTSTATITTDQGMTEHSNAAMTAAAAMTMRCTFIGKAA